MKYKIKKEKWEKVLSNEIEVDIPEKPCYFWHNGIRKAYSVVPVWTTWNKKQYNKEEEILEMNIIEVDPSDYLIHAYSVYISSFADIMMLNTHCHHRLVENILLYPDENTRTKEQFMIDYNRVLEEIAKKL